MEIDAAELLRGWVRTFFDEPIRPIASSTYHWTDDMSADLIKGFQRVAPATGGAQPIMTHCREAGAARAIRGHIAVYLGPATAQAAVTACCHALGREPESMERKDAPQLLAGLRPMLGTLLGGSSCRMLLHRIERDLLS